MKSNWPRERARQKIRFEKMGITTCELRLPGCWHDTALGFAHLDKRRFLKPEELSQVALLCSPVCHAYVERLPRPEMRKIIQGIIDRREMLQNKY